MRCDGRVTVFAIFFTTSVVVAVANDIIKCFNKLTHNFYTFGRSKKIRHIFLPTRDNESIRLSTTDLKKNIKIIIGVFFLFIFLYYLRIIDVVDCVSSDFINFCDPFFKCLTSDFLSF